MELIQMLLCTLLALVPIWVSPSLSDDLKCETLKIKVCQKLNYNDTVFPNAHHRTQFEAEATIRTLVPLLKSGCSRDLLYLTCSYYAPVCTSYNILVPPCRSLCRSVRKDCLPALRRLYGNIDWKSVWDCRKLPSRRKTKICFGRAPQHKRNNSSNTTRDFYI